MANQRRRPDGEMPEPGDPDYINDDGTTGGQPGNLANYGGPQGGYNAQGEAPEEGDPGYGYGQQRERQVQQAQADPPPSLGPWNPNGPQPDAWNPNGPQPGGWNPNGQPLGGYGGYDQPISPDLRAQAHALGAQAMAPQQSGAYPQPPGMAEALARRAGGPGPMDAVRAATQPQTLGALAAPKAPGGVMGAMRRATGRRKRPGTDLNPAADFLSRSPVPPGAPAPLGAMPTDPTRRMA
jgi:hypothetical protein